ncbi:hypothetical protein Hanom_Chr00s012081g01748601 [Helianthus anomalus]
MVRGLGRELAENAQATTPGGLRFGRGPRDGSLKPGVGRASDPMWPAPIRLLARS